MWDDAPPIKQPSESERAKELSAREEAIQSDIKRLRARMKQTPAAKQLKAVNAELDEIHRMKGWSPQLEHAFILGSIDAYKANQSAMPQSKLDAFIQF